MGVWRKVLEFLILGLLAIHTGDIVVLKYEVTVQKYDVLINKAAGNDCKCKLPDHAYEMAVLVCSGETC